MSGLWLGQEGLSLTRISLGDLSRTCLCAECDRCDDRESPYLCIRHKGYGSLTLGRGGHVLGAPAIVEETARAHERKLKFHLCPFDWPLVFIPHLDHH